MLSSVVLLVMCQLFMGVDRVPIALIAFVYGLIIAVATHPEVLSELSWGISLPAPILPSKVRKGPGKGALTFSPSTRLFAYSRRLLVLCAVAMSFRATLFRSLFCVAGNVKVTYEVVQLSMRGQAGEVAFDVVLKP